jgi:peptide/nickel transport system permease protein/oligopeptide transport system permease protein
MITYSIRRILLFVPVLFAVLFITFTLGFYAPGDPLEIQFGQDYDPDPVILARLRAIYGLDRPFYVQFGDYIWKLVHGDMGESIKPGPKREIWDKIKGAFPISAQLGGAAGVLLVLIAIPLGVLAAAKQNTWIDYVIVTGAIAASSVHVIVLAPGLMVLFVLVMDIMDVPVGWEGLFSTNAIIPVMILVITGMLGPVRLTRASVLEIIRQNYVRTARAKGLFERKVVTRHMIKNALTPVLTQTGLTLAGLITGTFFIERIFGIPGFAGMGIAAFQSRDYPVILATTMIGATIIIIANLLVDLGYGFMDPRVRIS